jgi:hypothetical protein
VIARLVSLFPWLIHVVPAVDLKSLRQKLKVFQEPRLGRSLAELGLTVGPLALCWAWPLDRCVAYAKAHAHPELAGQTVWPAFEAERGQLVAYRGPFDGFHAVQASVSKTCLVRFDNNKYSVASRAVGRPVEVQAYAERIVIRQDDVVVAEHARCFGRGEVIYNPWALRAGSGAQAWRVERRTPHSARRSAFPRSVSRVGCSD